MTALAQRDSEQATTPVHPDGSIQAQVADHLRTYTGGQQWRVEVIDGRVDLYGEPDDARTTCALLALAGTVPGVASVHMYCGQASSRR
jgi:osmotically-inducible protein OsmY